MATLGPFRCHPQMYLVFFGIVFILWMVFPVKHTFSGEDQMERLQSPDNLFGLSFRESRLADRVRDIEDQNRMLRKQLSYSQSQLIKARKTSEISNQPISDEGEVFNDQHEYPLNEPNTAVTKNCRDSVEDELPSCEILHIAIVCAGHNSSRSVVTVIKSLLFYRKHPLHFHFLTNNETKEILDDLFKTWLLNQVKISFYPISSVEDQVSWIPNKHYSGVYGLLKLTLPKILTSTPKVIVLDTDVILATDISKVCYLVAFFWLTKSVFFLLFLLFFQLWRLFDKMAKSDASIGLVENQSDWYIPGKLWKGHSPWPALGRGYNTGVILMDLEGLRKRWQWSRLWRQVAEKELITMFKTTLADQDIFNAVIKSNPQIVFNVPCQWNLQLSDNTQSEICYSNTRRDLNLIHFNSPKKLDVKNKDVEYFRNHYLTFLQYDGNLLRRDLMNCHNLTDTKDQAQAKQTLIADQDCYELRNVAETVYRYRRQIFELTT